MKTAICIISVGDTPYQRLSLKANTRYCKHFGIDLRVVTKMPDQYKEVKPKWLSSLIFEVYPDLDFAIVQDLDILPCNFNYNILDFMLYNELNFAKSWSRVGMKVSAAPFPFFQWNAGLFGYSKQYSMFFKHIFEYGKSDPDKFGTCDQYYINKFIGERELYVNEIPLIFNTFYYPNIDYSKTAFCHYTYNIKSEQKLETIQKYHPKEMIS